jgi:hypothetical protein
MLFILFVQWKIKTKQFLAELRLLHPGVRLSRTAGLFLRRTSYLCYIMMRLYQCEPYFYSIDECPDMEAY